MSCFLGFLPDIFFYVIIKSSLLILTFFVFFLFLRFSGVFVNMSLTFQKADMQADLDWWSRNHGTGMPQNWPVFEVLNVLFCTVCLFYSWTIQSGVLVCISLGKFFLRKFG